MTVEELIKRHYALNDAKPTDMPWIQYCEIIITKDGDIIEATPSHMVALTELYCKEFQVTEDKLREFMISNGICPIEFMVERLQCVSLWYYFAIAYPDVVYNEKVMAVLERLFDIEMLSDNCVFKDAYEYTWWWLGQVSNH